MLSRLKNIFLSKPRTPNAPHNIYEYWKERARRYGKRSVINLSHGEEEYQQVTNQQQQMLFPLLKSKLTGQERLALDFGCGPGRFSTGIAECINGAVIGVDISPELISLAPTTANVNYLCIGDELLPFENSTFDVVWSCLVLGGIPRERIGNTLFELNRVLKEGGLFFLVENTSQRENATHWFFRSEDDYIRMSTFCSLSVIDRYTDLGEIISIFSGRKI